MVEAPVFESISVFFKAISECLRRNKENYFFPGLLLIIILLIKGLGHLSSMKNFCFASLISLECIEKPSLAFSMIHLNDPVIDTEYEGPFLFHEEYLHIYFLYFSGLEFIKFFINKNRIDV